MKTNPIAMVWPVTELSCGTFYCAIQGDSNFGDCGWNPIV